MNPYEIMGVPRDVSPDALRRRYLELVRECHPDHGGSQQRMADINAAYLVLRDPEKRARADRAAGVEMGELEGLEFIGAIVDWADKRRVTREGVWDVLERMRRILDGEGLEGARRR